MNNRWIVGARLRTLPAAIVPVVAGTAAAVGEPNGGIVWWRVLAAMVVALSIQVATNYVNDYADGRRGTDDRRVGPTRLVASGLATANEVKLAAGVAALVTAVAGIALAVAVGSEIIVVGVACLLAGYFYTGGPKPYGYLGLGEVFVFVFFGIVATVGSSYVQLDRLTALSFGVAIAVGFLATALLVVNNLRDIPTDAGSGKRTLAVRMGDSATRVFYVGLIAGAFAMVPLIALRRPWALLAVGAIVVASRPVRRIADGASGMGLIAVLGDTGRLQLAFGALLALGLAVSG